MTKDEAEREVIRRWRALPIMERQSFAQAAEFARSLGGIIEFHTTGNVDKVMAAWLIRDLEQAGVALRTLDTRAQSRKPAAVNGREAVRAVVPGVDPRLIKDGRGALL